MVEVDERKDPRFRIGQSRFQLAVVMSTLLALAVGREHRLNDVLLVAAEPGRDTRLVRQHFIEQEADQNGGQAFDQEHPLPALVAKVAIHARHDHACDTGRR